MALVLEVHARDTLSGVDDAVRRIKRSYERDGMRTDLRELMTDRRDIAGYIAVVSVADERGRLILSTLPIPPGAAIADLEHFRAHVARDTGEPYINKPVLGRVSGKWSFQISTAPRAGRRGASRFFRCGDGRRRVRLRNHAVRCRPG